MPDHNTRQTTTDRHEEAVTRLTQSQNTLAQNHVALSQAQTAMNSKVDSILEHLRLHDSGRNAANIANHQNHQRNSVKLDIPRFDGRDPLGWIFKITQLFQYQNTSEEERITVASLYLDGVAPS